MPQIREALRLTKAAVGVNESSDWEKPYYQYANRLAFVHFLTERDIPARLLFIYFAGDTFEGRACPKTEEGWGPALQAMRGHLGPRSARPFGHGSR